MITTRHRIQAFWDGIRTGLWFVPTMMMLVACGLAAGTITLDAWLTAGTSISAPWWVFASTPSEARNLAASLLTALITMTSLAFSITMVVLSLASSQFGPRLIRNFMAGIQTQMVLGTFAMTILYFLILLPSIGRGGRDDHLPFFSISFGVLLTVISVVLLVFYFHYLGRSIISESVIERVGRELDDYLSKLAPIGTDRAETDPVAALPPDFDQRASRFGPVRSGYIRAMEFSRLADVAAASGALVAFSFRPGEYVAADGHGIGIYPAEADMPELRRQVLNCLSIGVHRTPAQDPEYSIRHLVEIAVRALSPGTNDPYTAVAVVHRLSACLATAMRLAMPAGVFRDKDGAARVICPRPTHGSLVAGSFDQIRQNAGDKPLVLIHLIEALHRVGDHAALPEQSSLLLEQLDIILADADRLLRNPADRSDVQKRATKTRELLSRGP